MVRQVCFHSGGSLTPYIAWISTCLIVSATRPCIGAETFHLCGWWGCFGLTAAVGMEGTKRVHARMRNRRMVRSACDRLERRLASLSEAAEVQ